MPQIVIVNVLPLRSFDLDSAVGKWCDWIACVSYSLCFDYAAIGERAADFAGETRSQVTYTSSSACQSDRGDGGDDRRWRKIPKFPRERPGDSV
jgi:hypothetical protein